MHAKDGQEGEAMRPDGRHHMSRWSRDVKGRVEASEKRGLKAIHQVYCVQSTHGLSFG